MGTRSFAQGGRLARTESSTHFAAGGLIRSPRLENITMTSEEAYWAGLGPADFNDEPLSPPEQLEQTTRELVAEAARLQYPTEGEFAVPFWE